MPLTCSKCGAENRDSAKFCLKCAHQLVPLPPAAAPAPSTKTRKRRRQRLPHTLYMEWVDNAPRPPWRLIAATAVLLTGAALWALLLPPQHTVAVKHARNAQAATNRPATRHRHTPGSFRLSPSCACTAAPDGHSIGSVERTQP